MVTEEIISITGQQVELKKQWIDLKQEKDVMFLDSWEVSEALKENKVHVHSCTVQYKAVA